jgi:hypothetical protein
MSPRYTLAKDDAVVAAGDARRAARARATDEAVGDPYRAMYAPAATTIAGNVPVHSYWRDLLVVSESEARAQRSLEQALRRWRARRPR